MRGACLLVASNRPGSMRCNADEVDAVKWRETWARGGLFVRQIFAFEIHIAVIRIQTQTEY